MQKELKEFLSYDFFPRCGGGIGVGRLIRALTLAEQGVSFGKPVKTTMHQPQHEAQL